MAKAKAVARKITLAEIYLAGQRAPANDMGASEGSAWDRLAASQKPIVLVQRIAKYRRLTIMPELELINEFRQTLVEKHGTEDKKVKGQWAIPIGKPLEAFNKSFTEYCDGESDIPQIDMTMDELVAGLGKYKNSTISEDDYMLLEPFFKEA